MGARRLELSRSHLLADMVPMYKRTQKNTDAREKLTIAMKTFHLPCSWTNDSHIRRSPDFGAWFLLGKWRLVMQTSMSPGTMIGRTLTNGLTGVQRGMTFPDWVEETLVKDCLCRVIFTWLMGVSKILNIGVSSREFGMVLKEAFEYFFVDKTK